MPLRKQPVSDPEHLELVTKFRETLSEPYPVLECETGCVGLLEGREGKDLSHRDRVAAAVRCDEFAQSKKRRTCYRGFAGLRLQGIPAKIVVGICQFAVVAVAESGLPNYFFIGPPTHLRAVLAELHVKADSAHVPSFGTFIR